MSERAGAPEQTTGSRPPLYIRRPFLAGLLRLLLPLRRIGFLAVRSRPVDVALTAGTGLALVVFALATPYR